MERCVPFISTTPLEILAFGLGTLFFIIGALAISLVMTIVFSLYDIDVAFERHGYDLLITQGASLKTGVGFIFDRGLELWKYKEFNNGEKNETRMFPSKYS